MKYYCDQCTLMVINLHPCHEHNCPNKLKPWTIDKDTDRIRPMTEEELEENEAS
ncbi:MAG: hypothetical protein ACKOX6_12085 [Bdellovibrio sp.]